MGGWTIRRMGAEKKKEKKKHSVPRVIHDNVVAFDDVSGVYTRAHGYSNIIIIIFITISITIIIYYTA